MTKTDEETKNYVLWIIGNICAGLITFQMATEYSTTVGLTVGYTIMLLVDIRRNTGR